MSIFDLWDQARNTAVINRSVQTVMEQQPRPAAQLAPVIPVTDDKIKLERMEVRAFGKARFKAFGATPPIFVPRIRYTEEEIELIQIAEMSPVDERLLRKLESTDDKIKSRAGADILLRGRALQIRNERQSDWMVLTAFLTGQLPVQFEDEPGQGFVIDYGFDPSHLATVTTPWSDLVDGTPIDDMRAWQNLLADSAGDYGIHFWMNSTTWDYVIYGAQAREILTGTDRGQLIPTVADIKARMYEPERVTFHITDAGYREESAGYGRTRTTHTKWFADNQVLVTTDDPFEGERLAEMFDGLVAVQTDWNKVDLRQGPQSEVQVDRSKTHYWIQTSTRMPRINRPECIVSADVS